MFLKSMVILLVCLFLIQQNELPIKEKTFTQNENKKNIDVETTTPDSSLKDYQEQYQNEDIIARLEIPGLFNIWITKCDNNEYYLTHSLTKEKDVRGTEFMDYRVSPDSQQINIYGHNSQTYNTPFHKLENFKAKDFFDSHKYILLQTEERRRIYEIFSIKEVSTDTEHMKVKVKKEAFIQHIEKLKNNSIHERAIEYNEESNILVLQTCSYDTDNSYYVISAIEIEIEEKRT